MMRRIQDAKNYVDKKQREVNDQVHSQVSSDLCLRGVKCQNILLF